MEYDSNKIDEAVLAVLLLTLHDNYYAWKNINWDVMDRLYEKGREVFDRLFSIENKGDL